MSRLNEINPKAALVQVMNRSADELQVRETKFGKSPMGSFASYQLAITEDNFKVSCNLAAVPSTQHSELLTAYPRFPLSPPKEQFNMPSEIWEAEKDLLLSLIVDCQRLNEIESKTMGQAVKNGKMNGSSGLQLPILV